MARMVRASPSVMVLATIIGQLPIKTPNSSQKPTPAAKTIYMRSEIAFVSLLRMTCSACGTKAAVVSVAAKAETQSSISSSIHGGCRAGEPAPVLLAEQGSDLLPHLSMVGVEPAQLFRGEEGCVD